MGERVDVESKNMNQMLLQQIVGGAVFALMAAIIVWMQIQYRKEMKRRAKLPPEKQHALKQADADWSQRYGF